MGTGYRGATAKGYKVIDGKRYKLWGWLTSSDKRKGTIEKSLRSKYEGVRIQSRAGGVYAVWVR